MTMPSLHFRPRRNQATWRGAPAQTWTTLRRAASALLTRWRPAVLVLTRTPFDEYDLPHGATTADRLDVRESDAGLTALADVSDVLAADPINARVAVPAAAADDATLWFIDPDQRVRDGRLVPAPDLGTWQTRWFLPDCPLMRGFSLHIPQRGIIEAQWDLGIFAGNEEPSEWKTLDGELDQWLVAQLKTLGFQPA